MPSTVVRRGENCEELAAGEPLEAIHDALVRTKHKAAPVSIEEVFDAIWTEFDNVSSSVWISNKVRLNA